MQINGTICRFYQKCYLEFWTSVSRLLKLDITAFNKRYLNKMASLIFCYNKTGDIFSAPLDANILSELNAVEATIST